ncbi:DUF349 domain-containing protein [Massilia sp. H-1]|nr:DUF349 domain-containing protein [Massilia sp. H-1]
MQAPLEQQRKDEVAVREELIARVAALNPADRHTLDTLKALQERWQEHARALPLERKSEQALWQRFRAACDAVFAKRKETAHAADAERRQHQHAKEAVCVRLEEAAAAADAASARKASCCARRPPNGMPSALSRAPTKPASTSAIRPLSRRCSTISTAPGATPGVPRPPRCATSCTCARRSRDNWPTARPIRPPPTGTRWAALLGTVGADYDKALQARLQSAIAAIGAGRDAYAATLARNSASLMHEVLRLEIGAEHRQRQRVCARAPQAAGRNAAVLAQVGPQAGRRGDPVPAAVCIAWPWPTPAPLRASSTCSRVTKDGK